jgi:hypothetical protein
MAISCSTLPLPNAVETPTTDAQNWRNGASHVVSTLHDEILAFKVKRFSMSVCPLNRAGARGFAVVPNQLSF